MIGLEPTWEEHLDNLLAVFRQVWRVMRDDAVLIVNYGDAYSSGNVSGHRDGSGRADGQVKEGSPRNRNGTNGGGLPAKNLMMMPSRFALAMQEDGWILRSMIPWIKPNPMPESVTDRPTNAVEYFFLFAKKKTYFWDAVAVRTPIKSSPEKIRANFGMGFRGERLKAGTAYVNQAGPQDNSRLTDKQRGHSRHHDGFNDRWDAMSKAEQQAGGANMRNYLFEATVPFRGAHFATFPPSVIEPFILAGTSAKGCCPECGAPWVRTTKSIGSRNPKPGELRNERKDGHLRRAGDYNIRTLGWAPSCECKAGEPKPAVILDPFAGAGTTGLVADRHQRDAVLIEISDEYADLARERIHGDAPLLADV